MTNVSQFTAWLDDFLAAYYRQRPVNATFIGVHDYDDRLPDYSEQGLGDIDRTAATLLARLRELPAEPLSAAATIDRTLAERFLEIQRWELGSAHFQRGNPTTYTGEATFGVLSLLRRPFAPLAERLEHVAARLAAVPELLAQAQANVRQAPLDWTEKAIDECAGALALFGGGLDQLLAEQAISKPALRAAADTAMAAVAEYQRYLQTELRQHANDAYACGDEALDMLIRRGHCLPTDADEIERYAEDQIAQSSAYLEQHARDFGASSWQAALAQLAELHPTSENYYARYGEIWQDCYDAAAQHQLLTWPDYPIRYVPRPGWVRQAAPHLYFLFYHAPAPFDHLPEVEYLVTPIEPSMPAEEQQRLLRANNDSVIKLNHVVHHGAIGHQVQNWHAERAASRIGQIAGVDCAARIALFCGGTMTEGWACYATELMDEVGFLTPLEHFSECHTRLRMAARALVDVQLHRRAITLDQAAALYHERVGMAPAAARGEAIKNSMFPGTALMYLTGTDTIHTLRRELAAQPGFNLRDFHDRFLSYGSIPAPLVAAAMRSKE